MKALPEQVVAYEQTPEFTESSVPAALLRSHRTKPGVWGVIRVLEGELVYRILEPHVAEHVLAPGIDGIVEPANPHEVEPRGRVRFYVEFCRAPGEREI